MCNDHPKFMINSATKEKWAHCKMTQNPNDKWQALSGNRFVIDTTNEKSIALNVEFTLLRKKNPRIKLGEMEDAY